MGARVLVLLVVFWYSGPVFASQVAAKKDGVKVYKEPTKKSEEIASLKKDQAVEALKRKAMYWHVKLNGGQEGYVSFIKVKRLSDSSSGLSSAIKEAAHESRDMDNVKSQRSRSAVMGVRGLNEGEQAASAGNIRPNMRMVYQMEDRVINEKRMERHSNMIQKEIEMHLKRKRNLAH